MNDTELMQRSLALAEQGRPTTSPNPMVGAVVVRDGVIVGEGFHRLAGEPHAEPIALDQAGDLARGATLFVTLEPCCHQGRTPPCTERIISAGVKRVVAAMIDPFPKVSGGGFLALRNAGIEVVTGVLEADAMRLNEAFIKRVRTGLPWVTVKAAVTLDGKMATRTGDSKWITGEEARREAHRLRARHNVVMVGIGTVLADDPLLTCRLHHSHYQPWRAVMDTHGRLPPESKLVKTATAETPVFQFVAEDLSAPRLSDHVRTYGIPRAGKGLDLEKALRTLAEHGANSVMAEGGARLLGSFLRGGLTDYLALFIAPRILGDSGAPSFVSGMDIDHIADCINLTEIQTRNIGGDLLIEGYIHTLRED